MPTKNAKIMVVWGVRGHLRSFDRAYNFLFDFNGNYASILDRFRATVCFTLEVANFNPPYLHLIRIWP